jgi:hypothetical protein
MKQPTNMLLGAPVGVHLHETFAKTSAGISALTQVISNGLAQMFLTLQIGRMTSVLTAMSDEQLDQIGVQRKDIERHARKLITGDDNGF